MSIHTIIRKINKEHPDPEVIREAGGILRAGGLVAFPTETVYGLGADALNEEAAKKIYAAKGRPSDNPLIIHITHRYRHRSSCRLHRAGWGTSGPACRRTR